MQKGWLFDFKVTWWSMLRLPRAVRKTLRSHLSSLCQSPSNRSRNRYRGGSGSTSFSSSTMVLLLLEIPSKRHQKKKKTLRKSGPRRAAEPENSASSAFCYSEHKWATNTFMALMAGSSSLPWRKKKLIPLSAPAKPIQHLNPLHFSSLAGNRSLLGAGEAPLSPGCCGSRRATGCVSWQHPPCLPARRTHALGMRHLPSDQMDHTQKAHY